MNAERIKEASWMIIVFGMVFAAACTKSPVRKPATEVFRLHRGEIEELRALEAKHIRPAALIQISTQSDATRYLTGNGLETSADSWKPYPDRKVLEQYQSIIRVIGAEYVTFSNDASFTIVFMNEPFTPPEEDGLIYEPDSDAIRSPRYPDKVVSLGDGWYAYDRKWKKQ